MIDENCERIKLSKTLSDLGMKVAAVSILCQDERVFFAMEQSGTPCPFEGKIGKAASDQWKKYDKLRPDYAMYTERLWKIEQVKKEIKKKQELQEWKDKLEVKKEVEGDTSETDALAEEIKKLQETIAEDKKKVENK
jgi:DNA-binding transcriptional MerR regulator